MALRARIKQRQGGSPNSRTQIASATLPSRSPSEIRSSSSLLGNPSTALKGSGSFAAAAAPVGVTPPNAVYTKVAAPTPTAPTPGASSTALRNEANTNFGIAQGQNRDAIFRAVMQLGDPTLFAKYQADPNFAGYSFAQDPNSIFASLGRQEKQGLEDTDANTLAGNTFFSSNRLRDRTNLSDEAGRQRLAGTTGYLDNLKDLAASLGLAGTTHDKALSDADQMDIDNALAQDRYNAEHSDQPGITPPGGSVPTQPPGYTVVGQGGISTGNTTLPGVGGLPAQAVPAGNIYGSTIIPTTASPGYTHVQTDGPRMGMSYNVVKKNGKRYKFYQNGDEVIFN